MSLANLFASFRAGEGSQQQPPQPPANVAANATVPNGPGEAGKGANPPAIPEPGQGAASPLEKYTKLWQPADTDLKPMDPAISFNADPKAVMDAARQIDITKAINPELLAKVQAGNDPASLVQLVNEAVQVGIAHATQSTTGIVNKALELQSAKYQDEIIPRVLRENNIRNTNRADDPLFQNPAAAPMLSMLESQLVIKYPQASPAEIRQMSQEYMGQFATTVLESRGMQVSKADPRAAAAAQGGVGDWTAWAQKRE